MWTLGPRLQGFVLEEKWKKTHFVEVFHPLSHSGLRPCHALCGWVVKPRFKGYCRLISGLCVPGSDCSFVFKLMDVFCTWLVFEEPLSVFVDVARIGPLSLAATKAKPLYLGAHSIVKGVTIPCYHGFRIWMSLVERITIPSQEPRSKSCRTFVITFYRHLFEALQDVRGETNNVQKDPALPGLQASRV